MKRLQLLLFVILLSVHDTYAQKWDFGESGKKLHKFIDVDTIDVSQIECIYQHTTLDTYLQEHRSEFDILLVGKQWAKYMDHNKYICDSLLQRVDRSTFTVNDYFNLTGPYNDRSNYLLTRIADRRIEHHDNVFIDYFVYEDSTSDMNWELIDDTMTVCNHLCHKAVTDFRGRRWEAWYCDAPINLGPWKFSGLPGLILKVQDTEEEHVFEALSLKRRNTGIYREPHTIESTTTRERFNKSYNEYHINPHAAFVGELQPKDVNGNPVEPDIKHYFFNPIEKE